ncbi:MAG: ABC transporter permease [Gammaproteobacteria bacterium]
MLALLSVSVVPTAAALAAALWFGLDANALTRVFETPGIGLSIASSLWTGCISTAIALVLAHLAVALAASGGWGQRLNSLMLPLLAMPHLAIGIGLALVLAPSGVLMRLLSPWATGFDLPPDWLLVNDPAGVSMMIGLVLKETCFLIMALIAARAQVPSERLQMQAATLGYGPLKSWFTTVIPALQRQIRLPCAAVLVFGITNVEMAIPLGPQLPPTFCVLLWRWFTDPDPAIHVQAYAGTLVLFVISIAAIAVAFALGRLVSHFLTVSAQSGVRRANEGRVRRAVGCLLAVGWSMGALCVVAIVLRAIAGTWRFPALLPASDPFVALQNLATLTGGVGVTTLVLASVTALTGLALVLPAAERCKQSPNWRRQIGAYLFLPLLVPQMTFLFGLQVLLVRLNIDGTFVAVLWSHLIFVLPYLWGILAPARAAIDPRYEQVAATLGISRSATWVTVTAPLLTRAALLALALAFSVSVALYLPTLFAGAGRFATAATEAAAAASSGNLRLASSHAILLAMIPLATFAVAFTTSALLFRQRRGVPK